MSFGPYVYFNNGHSFRTVSAGYQVETGEVLFEDTATEEELQAAFENYSVITVESSTQISMVQCRIALRRAGLLDSVEAAVTAAGGEVLDRWNYGTLVNRNDMLVESLATQLGITETQLDELFIAALLL